MYSIKHFIISFGVLSLFTVIAFAQEPNWNQFRGPNSDNHSFSTGIAKSWGTEGPKLLWKIDNLGAGYSTISFYGDKMFTSGDIEDQCYVFCLDRTTGKEIWKTPIGKGGDGGGRRAGVFATPASDGEMVYAVSQFSDFVALDILDGSVRWRKNTQNDLGGTKMATWGYSMSPVIDGDKIILSVGGEGGTLAAFSKSGELLWRSTQIKDPAAYTSAVPVTIEGIRQYLLLTGNNLVGISPTDGKVLWEANFPGQLAVCSDPVLCGDVVMASCSYNVGAYFYRITKEDGNFKAVDFESARTDLQSHHGGIVAVGGHFYLLTNNNLACVEAKTGKTVWSNRSVGKGCIAYVDGVLILRSESGDGTIAMVEATPNGYNELGRFDQPDRSDKNSWTYPVIVDKKMYIRDQNVLLCYDLQDSPGG